jgi:hypothetical protein
MFLKYITMPYTIRKVKNGFKVFKKGSQKSFSKKPLSLSTAKKQMKAIGLSESKQRKYKK